MNISWLLFGFSNEIIPFKCAFSLKYWIYKQTVLVDLTELFSIGNCIELKTNQAQYLDLKHSIRTFISKYFENINNNHVRNYYNILMKLKILHLWVILCIRPLFSRPLWFFIFISLIFQYTACMYMYKDWMIWFGWYDCARNFCDISISFSQRYLLSRRDWRL